MAGDFRSFGELFAESTRNGLTRPRAVRGVGVKMVNMGELFAYPRLQNATMDRVLLSPVESAKFLLKEGDLLFARQSLVLEGAGKCSIFLNDSEPVTFESHVTRVRLDPLKADARFYYYYLQSHHGRSAIISIVEQGAGASGIRGSDLGKLVVRWFPVEEQRAIAHILGTLDDKIELSRKMNETLEAMARALFKSWFVDFDPVRAKVEGRHTGLPKHIADTKGVECFNHRIYC
jgi:type I restriction enzyme S subunit